MVVETAPLTTTAAPMQHRCSADAASMQHRCSTDAKDAPPDHVDTRVRVLPNYVGSNFQEPNNDRFTGPASQQAPATMAESAARPSVRAAGPGCRISGDLISWSAPRCTAGMRSKPGRLTTFSGRNFLPHHEPMMMSGARAMTSAAVTMRSLADLRTARSAKISLPPAASINSETQPMPEIIG